MNTLSSPVYIWFSQIPPPSDVGNKQIYPFTISLSSTYDDLYEISLYAQYSNSSPYQKPQNKWSQLVPQWRFTDLDGNNIDTLSIQGTAGSASFYYIDDMGTNECEPVYIWATTEVFEYPISAEVQITNIDLASYSNSKIAIFLPYYINKKKPTNLQITRNGVVSLSGFYWENSHIPNIISIHGNSYVSGWSVNTDNILMDYPISNATGQTSGVISRGIMGLSAGNQVWTSVDSDYFQKVDKNNLEVGGYNRQVVVPSLTANNVSVSASSNLIYDTPYINYTPFMWVSNPDNGTLNKLYYPKNCRDTTDISESKYNLQQTYNAPLTDQTSIPCGLSGFTGIYGIAVDPSLNVWCTDTKNNKIYKYGSNGEQLVQINCNYTPAEIVVDKNLNIWVTLFNSTSVFNFDTYGNYVSCVNVSGNINTGVYYKPVTIEIDDNNHLLATFSDLASCKIYQYDTISNTLIKSINLPARSYPMDILVDHKDNLWVSLIYNNGPQYSQGNIKQYNNNLNETFSWPVSNPGYLTIDFNNENIWYTYNFYEVGYINMNTHHVVTSGVIVGGNVPKWANFDYKLGYGCLQGIACDWNNRIWVINSMEDVVWILNDKTTGHLDTFYIRPSSYAIQAIGDWSGLNWYAKYNSTNMASSINISNNLSGISDPFNIERYVNYEIRRFNESWDATSHIHNLALPEYDYANYNLFENVIDSIVGSVSSNDQELMRPMYEKIANFVPEHQDIDSCNIEQLYSLARELHVPIDDYIFEYPFAVRRLLDIFSVNFNKLKGSRCKCNLNFSNSIACNNCGHEHIPNLGDQFDFMQYMASANVPFLVKNKWLNNSPYEIIIPTTTVSLSAKPVMSILSPASEYLNYYFYTYITTFCNKQVEGVINWDDQLTTLSENITTVGDWYGDAKTVEKIINYALYKGLDLI